MAKKSILLFLMFFMLVPGVMKGTTMEKVKKELLSDLADSDNASDSIKVLYNLYDLVPRKEKVGYARILYGVAERSNNDKVRLDVLRQLAQLTSVMQHTDSAYRMFIVEVNKIPKSDEQEETELYLRMKQASYEARHATQAQNRDKVAQLIADESTGKDMSDRDRILRLFTIVEYLSNGVQGDLLNEYIDLLWERMEQADIDLHTLKNTLLTESANIYTGSGNSKAAVEADRRLLKVLDQLERKHRSAGRHYRNYRMSRFIIYRRMMGNYKALTPSEIREIHEKVMELIEEDPEIAEHARNRPLVVMYYAMATRDYNTAIPIIRQELQNETGITKRRRLLSWLKEAAVATGNAQLEVEALRELNKLLVEREEIDAAAKYRELAIRTKVNELQADKEHLKLEQKAEELSNHRRLMIFIIGSWVLFGLLLGLFLYYWMHFRASKIRVRNFVNKLVKEREYLKESLYHDYHEPDNNVMENNSAIPAVERRPRLQSINKMFEYILNDLLYISSIGHFTRKKFIRPIYMNVLADDEAARARSLMPGNLNLEVILPDHEIQIRSDKECVEYVVRHLFKAAIRVSKPGALIRLEVREDPHSGKVELVFSNNSVTVPEGGEEMMFDEFINFEKLAHYEDAGLFLVRMSALLLESSIRLDREFQGGSCYIFTLSKVLAS